MFTLGWKDCEDSVDLLGIRIKECYDDFWELKN